MHKRELKSSIFFLTCFLIIVLPLPVFAGRYIVNNTTSSTDWVAAEWTNYPNQPSCKPCTPLTAMKNAKAGDVVYFRGGEGGNYDLTMVYYKMPALNPSNSGTSRSPITFRNYPGELPNLRNLLTYPTACWSCPLIGAYQKNWIIWDGFKLSAIDASGKVNFWESSNCILRNSEVIGLSIPARTRGEGNYDGVRISSSSYIIIENCNLHGVTDLESNHGNAVKLYSGYYTTVQNCTFYNNNSGICDKNDGQHNIYRLNLVRAGSIHPGAGIIVGRMATGPNSTDIKIYQNIVITQAGSSGIEASPTGVDGIQIYNNVIYSNNGWAINMQGATNQLFWNNIIVNSSKAIRVRGTSDGTPTYSNYNVFYKGQSFVVRDYEPTAKVYSSLAAWQASTELVGGGNPDINSLYIDPKFVNPGGNNANDYKLRIDSPCRGTGKDGKDMGAWPNGDDGTVIGYTSSMPVGVEIIQK